MTNIEIPMPPRRAGRRGLRHESHEPKLLLSQFRELAPLETPVDWDGSNGITAWGMDGNDVWGDCGGAATDHGNMAKAASTSVLNTLGKPTYEGTLPTYWAYGLAMGETGQPPNLPSQPDEGVDNASWLAFLYREGIIDGYGEVPADQIWSFAKDFGGLLIGLLLDNDAEVDFENHVPWGFSDETPNSDDGHDTWLIQTHADGSIGLITWGAIQQATDYFRQQNITDAWAIFDRYDCERAGYNWTAIKAVLDEIHGTLPVVQPVSPDPDLPVVPSSGDASGPGNVLRSTSNTITPSRG